MTVQINLWVVIVASCGWNSASFVAIQQGFALPRSKVHFGNNKEIKVANKATVLKLARNRNYKGRGDSEDSNRWYDAVSEDSTADEVFREEMSREKLLNEVGSSALEGVGPSLEDDEEESFTPKALSAMDTISLERALSVFNNAMVEDNYLGDDHDFYDDAGEETDLLLLKQRQDEDIDRQYKEWEEGAGDGDWHYDGDVDEPWDQYQASTTTEGEGEAAGGDGSTEDADMIKIDPSKADAEFLMQEDDYDDDDEPSQPQSSEEEQQHLHSLSKIKLKSPRLERARSNPTKAAQYFKRSPAGHEGYDRMWVSAIDEATTHNLCGVFRNYGIQFSDNFADWIEQQEDSDKSIEELASFKARAVFNVTGLPCIAARTSFEIEPVRPTTSSTNRMGGVNPRIASGYRFNNVAGHMDQLIDALLPHTDPSRITRFRTCLCFYDGTMEIYDYGECDVDIYYSNSLRTYIPVASAIDQLSSTLQLAYGLEYQKWLNTKASQANTPIGIATLRLRDTLLKEGRVLSDAAVIDVTAFMDDCVDVALLDECADELAKRFLDHNPTKILTVGTAGLIIAIPIARYLQIPVVHARNQRSITMSDTYKVQYTSKTLKNTQPNHHNQILIQRKHIKPTDKILIIDDFLSSGSKKEALLRLVIQEAKADVVGIGVLFEKLYKGGRQYLSAFDIPIIESMIKVLSVKDGIIQLLEEDGLIPDYDYDYDNETNKNSYKW